MEQEDHERILSKLTHLLDTHQQEIRGHLTAVHERITGVVSEVASLRGEVKVLCTSVAENRGHAQKIDREVSKIEGTIEQELGKRSALQILASSVGDVFRALGARPDLLLVLSLSIVGLAAWWLTLNSGKIDIDLGWWDTPKATTEITDG